jgi:hypothetical protein
MRKDRFNLCPAPQGGLIPQRSNFQTGHRLKRFFYFPVIHDDFRVDRIGSCRWKWRTKRKRQPWELRAVTGSTKR